jgi:hypothetical protein
VCVRRVDQRLQRRRQLGHGESSGIGGCYRMRCIEDISIEDVSARKIRLGRQCATGGVVAGGAG